MSRLQPARGTTDLLPETMAAHRKVIDAARNSSACYGFQEMATPIFEFSEIFSRPLGDSSDVVTKETYNFTDRGGESLTLRPENTASVVRAMISNGLTQALPLKYFYNGPMFRYERPQKGRMRQFHQIGVEYLGCIDPLSDVEIIACGARVLRDLGILDRCVLHLNSLGDTESRQKYRTALVAFLTEHQDSLSEDSKSRLSVNPLRILDSKDLEDRQILRDAPKLQNHLNDSSKAHFAAVTTALDAVNIEWKFDPLLVRGLDYYCHSAFEFVTDALGAQGTVLGGGRYDGLAEMMGGPAIAGVGWAAGIERLALLVGAVDLETPDIAIIAAESSAQITAFRIAEDLRSAGLSVDIPVAGKMSKKMKKVARAGIRFASIIGSAEIVNGTVQLRDLREGKQEELEQSGLVNTMITRLERR